MNFVIVRCIDKLYFALKNFFLKLTLIGKTVLYLKRCFSLEISNDNMSNNDEVIYIFRTGQHLFVKNMTIYTNI